MQSRVVGWICCTAALAIMVACGGSSSKPDSTTAAANVASGNGVKALAGGLKGLGQGLDDLLKDSAAFTNLVASAESDTPLQTPSQSKIKVDKNTCSHAGKSLITTQTFATSGVYSYADLTIGGQGNSYGYLLGRMQNDGDCAPTVIAVPPQKGTAPGVAFVFIALKANGNPTSAADYQVRVIDSTTRSDVGGSGFTIQTCTPDPKHQWYGDHGEAKHWVNRCDHKPPKNLGRHVTGADDIDDSWSLWFACGANCCYADTGGIGMTGDGDSTKTDTTHRDSSHKAHPAKKGGSA